MSDYFFILSKQHRGLAVLTKVVSWEERHAHDILKYVRAIIAERYPVSWRWGRQRERQLT